MLAGALRQRVPQGSVTGRLGDGQLVGVTVTHQAEILGQGDQFGTWAAAWAISDRAVARLACGSGVDTICRAATFMGGASDEGNS